MKNKPKEVSMEDLAREFGIMENQKKYFIDPYSLKEIPLSVGNLVFLRGEMIGVYDSFENGNFLQVMPGTKNDYVEESLRILGSTKHCWVIPVKASEEIIELLSLGRISGNSFYF